MNTNNHEPSSSTKSDDSINGIVPGSLQAKPGTVRNNQLNIKAPRPNELCNSLYKYPSIIVTKRRCRRCNRRILIRYVGQVYGPVCFKRIQENIDVENGQLRLTHFAFRAEVV